MQPSEPGSKKSAIVVKLYYYLDCVNIPPRTRGPLHFNGDSVTIFPDYTASVAKARAAFTDIRRLLRERRLFGMEYRFQIDFESLTKVYEHYSIH